MRRLLVATVVVEIDSDDVEQWCDSTELRVATLRDVSFAKQVYVHHFDGWIAAGTVTSEREPRAGDVLVRGERKNGES